jgi:predicted Zn finger-like uncharacterized protein
VSSLASPIRPFYIIIMILTCSLCQTRYLVPASLFDAGPRLVRCARCLHTWRAGLANETGDAVPPQTPPDPTLRPLLSETPPLLLDKQPPPRVRRVRLIGAAIAIGLFLLWLIFDRQQIAQNRPLIEKLYDSLGLVIYHYGGEGLSFEQVRSELRFDGGIMKLTVEGKIRNTTSFVQEIPDILASAIGPDGKTMQSWQIGAPAFRVFPGESVPFRSSINAPKGTVVDMNLSFIEIKNSDERRHHS